MTGAAILALAARHLGEPYVLGARARLTAADWRGPWDCAEFASWCVYQETGSIVYGAEPADDPARADAYTGLWADHSRRDRARITVEAAARTPGALLLRIPRAALIGHIAFSDGAGGTVEAHSAATGVCRRRVAGRAWDCGVLVPGVAYEAMAAPGPADASAVLRLGRQGPAVVEVQQLLAARRIDPGPVDGDYGPRTEAAVKRFQAARGLVADGVVGPATWAALRG